ncbi:MAG: hypothetical protein ABSH09_05940 [Bryobacteraceae bacterium]
MLNRIAKKPASTFTVVLACVLIACTVLAATLACGFHQHCVSHCCAVCDLGHLSCAAIAQAPQILPPVLRRVQLGWERAERIMGRATITALGRAPPAC